VPLLLHGGDLCRIVAEGRCELGLVSLRLVIELLGFGERRLVDPEGVVVFVEGQRR
jgi:hypothetical protein